MAFKFNALTGKFDLVGSSSGISQAEGDARYLLNSGDTGSGDYALSGYLRVGSTSAPNNTTAGDITGTRLSIGNGTLSATGGLQAKIIGTNTDTASGNAISLMVQPTFTPASNSSATFVSMFFDSIWNPSTGITQSALIGALGQQRVRGDGTITIATGGRFTAVVVDGSSAATATITSAIGFDARVFNRPSGTTTATITTGVAVDTSGASVAGSTYTDFIHLRVANVTATTVTNQVGLDIGALSRGGTLNAGVRIAAPSGATSNYALQLSDTGGTAAGGITWGTDVSLYRTGGQTLTNNGALITDIWQRIGTYLRVGSTSAPNNTTAGDLTATRIDVGVNSAFSATGRLARFGGTLTDTANGAVVAFQMQATINPATDSLTDFRSLSMSATTQSGGTVNLDNIIGGFFETRHQGTGATTITSLTAFEGINFLNGASHTGTITDVIGAKITPVSTTANSPTSTITQATGLSIGNSVVGSGPIVITSQYGVSISSLNSATTNNVAVRVNQPGIANGIGAASESSGFWMPTGSVSMGNQTATLTHSHGIHLGIKTMTSTTNTRTITNATSLYIEGAPVASTNVSITNGPYAIWVDTGTTRLDGDVEIGETAYFDAEVDDGNSSTADTIDWGTGNAHRSTMTGDCTYTFTAPPGAARLSLKLIQDGTGSRNPTWPASVKWAGGVEPTWSTAAGAIDIVTFYYDGTNYFGAASIGFA